MNSFSNLEKVYVTCPNVSPVRNKQVNLGLPDSKDCALNHDIILLWKDTKALKSEWGRKAHSKSIHFYKFPTVKCVLFDDLLRKRKERERERREKSI